MNRFFLCPFVCVLVLLSSSFLSVINVKKSNIATRVFAKICTLLTLSFSSFFGPLASRTPHSFPFSYLFHVTSIRVQNTRREFLYVREILPRRRRWQLRVRCECTYIAKKMCISSKPSASKCVCAYKCVPAMKTETVCCALCSERNFRW